MSTVSLASSVIVKVSMNKAPYEQLEEESAKAFEAFALYRDIGKTRSIREVVQKLNKSVALIGRWSSKYRWVERAQAYDEQMERTILLEEEKVRKDMRKRHAHLAIAGQQKLVDRINSLRAEDLSASDWIRWFDILVKIERLSRGESTEISEVSHSGEVKQKHENDIFQKADRYAEVYKKIADRGVSDGGVVGDDT